MAQKYPTSLSMICTNIQNFGGRGVGLLSSVVFWNDLEFSKLWKSSEITWCLFRWTNISIRQKFYFKTVDKFKKLLNSSNLPNWPEKLSPSSILSHCHFPVICEQFVTGMICSCPVLPLQGLVDYSFVKICGPENKND